MGSGSSSQYFKGFWVPEPILFSSVPVPEFANIVYYVVNLSAEITFTIIGDEAFITVALYSGIMYNYF